MNSQKLSAWFVFAELHGSTSVLCIINPRCEMWEEIIHSMEAQNDLELFSVCCPCSRMSLSASSLCFHWCTVSYHCSQSLDMQMGPERSLLVRYCVFAQNLLKEPVADNLGNPDAKTTSACMKKAIPHHTNEPNV